MLKKLTSLVLVSALSLCPVVKLSHAENSEESIEKIVSILETSEDNSKQDIDGQNRTNYDKKEIQKILKAWQDRERKLKDKKKSEIIQKIIKCCKIIKEVTVFSAALIMHFLFIGHILS